MTVQLTKMVLFAQLAAALSVPSGSDSASSSKGLGQVIPLLVLTVLYWAYLRIFVPLASLVDMFGEVGGFGGWFWWVGAERRQLRCKSGGPLLLGLHQSALWLHCLVTAAPLLEALLPVSWAFLTCVWVGNPCPLQVVSCMCDLGTFVCGLLVAILPTSDPHRT